MRKQLRFLTIAYPLFLILGMFSCQDDCPPFNSAPFVVDEISGLALSFQKNEDNNLFEFSEITMDTISSDAFVIKIDTKFIQKEIASYTKPILSFVPSAYACSPVFPGTFDVLKNIEIRSSIPFEDSSSIEDNLTAFFDIIPYRDFQSGSTEPTDLIDYINRNVTIGDEFLLVFKKPPENKNTMKFTVKIFIEGGGLNFYELTTEPLSLR